MPQKLNLLKKALGRCWSNGQEHLFHCPKCNHHKLKLSINIEKDCFKCWVCDYSGTKISALFKFYAKMYYDSWCKESGTLDLEKYDSIFEEKEKPQKTLISLPVNFQTLTGPKTKVKEEPLRYLHSRGLSDVDILRWKVGFCNYGDFSSRVIIPSFDSFGVLNYFIARTYKGDWVKYKNPKVSKDIIFNDLNIDWDSDIILVEGVFDAMKCENAIPILGSTLREDSRLFQKICNRRPRVYLALDSDAKEKELFIAKKLREYGIMTKSINIHPHSDIGEMTKEQILERKQNADIVSDLDYLHYKLDF